MYEVPEYKVFDEKEHKVRVIVCVPFRDRILHRFIVRKVVKTYGSKTLLH